MRISLEVKDVAVTYGIPIESLEPERVKLVKDECMQKYIKNKKAYFLWEELKDASLISDPNGWEKISDFIQDKSCLMFFTYDEDMLLIKNGKDFYKLQSEMYGFEFYITDFETSYLLCFSHHDILYGCGAAKPWVDSLKRLREEEEYRQILHTFHDEVPYRGRKGIGLEIKNVAETHGISVKSLEAERIRTVKTECLQAYVENKETTFLWERLKNPSFLVDAMSVKVIFDFVQDRNSLMFFDDDEDMLVIKNGRDLFTIVDEMPGFEFYLTDFDTTFLLCFNHHNCLFGCGAAKPWVNHIRRLGRWYDSIE